ncbi:MAG: DUF3298 and DUF4163 domain-containing protein [Kosmotoga sp.]|nr:MAG: DUF3298 and DUF4163 domain-containing protein [Kosmotoga sp.]
MKSKLMFIFFIFIASCFVMGTQVVDLTMKFDTLVNGTIRIPQFFGMENLATERYINEEQYSEASHFVDLLFKQAEEDKKDFEKQGREFRNFEVATEYKVGLNNDNCLSFYVDYYRFAGGAHGMTERKSVNYNLRTGLKLSLSDIFAKNVDYEKVILEEINSVIKEELEDDPHLYFEDHLDFLDYNKGFYLTEDELVIYFQLYEIAPYYRGIIEFPIDRSLFGDGLIY